MVPDRPHLEQKPDFSQLICFCKCFIFVNRYYLLPYEMDKTAVLRKNITILMHIE